MVTGMTSTPGWESASAAPANRIDTTEVRWFAAGSLPDSLVDWFIRSGRATLEVRHDSYLVDGSHDSGRKVRDHGSFEVKTRTGTHGFLHLGNGIRGRIEEWQKIVGLQPPTDQTWVDVGKVVLTRTYQPDPKDSLYEVRARDMYLPGCDVELATVSVGETKAWTFAFEVWGPKEQRHGILSKTASGFIDTAGLPSELASRLILDMGYPEWLATLG